MGRKSIMCSTAQATLLVSCVHLLNGWPHPFFFFFDVQCTFRSLRECFGWGGGASVPGRSRDRSPNSRHALPGWSRWPRCWPSE